MLYAYEMEPKVVQNKDGGDILTITVNMDIMLPNDTIRLENIQEDFFSQKDLLKSCVLL